MIKAETDGNVLIIPVSYRLASIFAVFFHHSFGMQVFALYYLKVIPQTGSVLNGNSSYSLHSQNILKSMSCVDLQLSLSLYIHKHDLPHPAVILHSLNMSRSHQLPCLHCIANSFDSRHSKQGCNICCHSKKYQTSIWAKATLFNPFTTPPPPWFARFHISPTSCSAHKQHRFYSILHVKKQATHNQEETTTLRFFSIPYLFWQ